LSKAVYTKSQAAMIAMTVTVINTVILGHGFAWLKGFATPVYWWIMIWLVILPLYIRLIKQAFLVGLVLLITYFTWEVVYPTIIGKNEWYLLTAPVFHLWFYTLPLTFPFFLYWGYNSFKQLGARDLARELGKRERMPTYFSLNQVGALAAIYNIALTVHGIYGTSIQFGFDHFFYAIIIIIAYLLIPFIVKLIKPAFIAGIILLVIAMIYIGIFPSLTSMEPWYIYAPRLYNFAYVIFYSITILGIYFCYETYKELK
jgi:hypothetical protein